MSEKAPQKLPISVFIIACNEEDRISESIKSVCDWVNEVIVVDSGSTDKTVSISKSLGAKVFEKDWPGYGPQKRFAEEQCQNKWVINLDADEVISSELAVEIQKLFRSEPSPKIAFKLKIKDVYPHQQKPCRFPYTYKVVRLYHLDQGRYSESQIHDRVIFKKDTNYITLKGSVYHKSIRSLSNLIAKANSYTDLQATVFSSQERKISNFRLIFEFPFSFLFAYLNRGNILRGRYGLLLSYHYAYIRLMRVAKIWEKQVIQKG
ncbi:MAG: glycosyltransferase family 2 protein [Alphaproteobacteria bacterium]|nr:glycosyltransferase family 2 protein [Alphaproteobacteria bacterium]